MDQAVMTFASSAARGSAIGTAVEGMVTWLNDENALQVYDGTAWNGLAASGGNAIINGAFEINQRGFVSTTSNGYGFDRWLLGLSGATGTYSAESFTLGSAPVVGYEAKNFARLAITTGNDNARLANRIEDVRSFAGQTATLSFWAKGTNPSTAGKLMARFEQNFGTGGSPSSPVVGSDNDLVLTADWTRYSFTFSIPSISGKTLGTDNNSHLEIAIGQGTSISTDAWTLDIWGVQLEAGPTANVFRRNANSLAGELAACQRYFERLNTPNGAVATIQATSTTLAIGTLRFNTKRVAPSLAFNSAGDFTVRNATNSGLAATSITIGNPGTSSLTLVVGVASGLVAGNAADMFLAGSASGFLDVSSEL
jgi:hypothetical protein